MIKQFLLIIIAAMAIASCGTINYQTIYYDKTLCSDPWHIEGASNSGYLSNAETYLLSLGIDMNPGTLNLVSGGEEVNEDCGAACNCPTGLRLILEVNKENVAELTEINFYQE